MLPSPQSRIVRHFEDVAGRCWGIEVVTRIRDPDVVRILWVDVDPAYESGGSLVDKPSIRMNVTEAAVGLSAFCDTKTRPVVVAAQRVPVSLGARSTAATLPPARSPNAADVSGRRPYR